ncbi:hypothetical protein ISN76_10180 [Dyella halodurans]|uniref:Triple tyrosine motif-containing protein n=2 Tax=Dyella halodurans TaxID=1920171 RepID=A0ABV9C2C5_9GAMM
MTTVDARSRRPLTDFSITPYAAQQGAPANVNWLAQTPDGFLWLCTSEGVVRFDGVSFERNLGNGLPGDSASAMFVDRSGDLWVGFNDGRIARRANGVFSEIDQGLPKAGRIIWSIVQDAGGNMWATSGYGLYYLDGSLWREVGHDVGANPGSVYGLAGLLDDGRLFVANNKKVWFQIRGTMSFEPGDSKEIWRSKLGFDYTQLPPGPAVDKLKTIIERPLGISLRAISRDATGALWALGDNVERFHWVGSPGGKQQLVVDELSYSADAYGLFSDREGNVWTASIDGIRRLRPNKFQSVFSKDTVPLAGLVRGVHEDIWIVPTQAGDVYDVTMEGSTKWDALGRGFASASSDVDGNIWFLKNDADPKNDDIRILKDGKFEHLPYPKGLNGRAVETILSDPAGGHLLVSTLGLYRYKDGAWLPDPVYVNLPRDPPRGARSDRFGRVWIMYADNRVAVIDKSGPTMFSSENGLSVGDPWSVYVGPTKTWVVGLSGIAYLDGNRFVSVSPVIRSNGEALKRILDAVETSDGDLWLNAGAGVAHISRSEIRRVMESPSQRPIADVLDEEDGLQGGLVPDNFTVSMIVDKSRRLWVVRAQGVSWIDLDHVPHNAVPPLVSFTRMDADDKHLATLPAMKLPALTRSVRIGFTAPSLSIPERVRFRVKLDGFDTAWQDAGAVRSSTYTNLGPGKYKFLVRASNEDGLWGEQDASLSFAIAPAYYQTWWFRAIAVLVALCALWRLLSLRIRQLQSRLHLQLTTRHAERERIARELHDTLMQGVHGLLLQVQSWSGDTSLAESRRDQMKRAEDQARSMLIEGRDRIIELRNSTSVDANLEHNLREICDESAAIYASTFVLTSEGVARTLRAESAGEVLNIGREAIRNAFAHSHASKISVHVRYGADGLHMLVSDDGCGIPADILKAGGRDGHWGIVGMRERAKRIGAYLEIRRGSQAGTEFVLKVPASVIYVAPARKVVRMIDVMRSKFRF